MITCTDWCCTVEKLYKSGQIVDSLAVCDYPKRKIFKVLGSCKLR